ncbi:hypothetical protein NEICINOT_04953 [Neisseria cinerea ATCC 14685]|uniref:Uncharacterized protein n=1 Tax=Neisseria cinerea ATCC 14685 TaxID=546262 RepID=D0W5I7_NEICI|nr:hypothetical protein NEICINOT_04953 [Neisseria cinerea ATCC 14685]
MICITVILILRDSYPMTDADYTRRTWQNKMPSESAFRRHAARKPFSL